MAVYVQNNVICIQKNNEKIQFSLKIFKIQEKIKSKYD